jgi:acyl carrier protein
MNREELKKLTLAILLEVVPEAEPAKVEPGTSFRDQFDMDSIDFLNFVLRLEKEVGIKVPELDYPRLSSLDGCLAYFEAKLAQGHPST